MSLDERSTEVADLRYINDDEPGIRRLKSGKSFRYVDAAGRPVRDRVTLQRIRNLAVPPAYTDVWICPDPLGHIQATARDARGRKQYRYHARWIAVRDADKFDRLVAFSKTLPRIRARVGADMQGTGLTRNRVLACLVHLLDTTLIRVGNNEYAKQNKSFGLTTLRDRHVVVESGEIRFLFKGKSGKEWNLKLKDRRLARLVKACQDIPGQRLFQYYDENGDRRPVTSGDVNAYIRDVAGAEFSAKDFRTWAGTVLAFHALCEIQSDQDAADRKRRFADAIRQVAGRLGNTPAVCRRCYVHPEVCNAFLEGIGISELVMPERTAVDDPASLPPDEAIVLRFLEQKRDRVTNS